MPPTPPATDKDTKTQTQIASTIALIKAMVGSHHPLVALIAVPKIKLMRRINSISNRIRNSKTIITIIGTPTKALEANLSQVMMKVISLLRTHLKIVPTCQDNNLNKTKDTQFLSAIKWARKREMLILFRRSRRSNTIKYKKVQAKRWCIMDLR